MTAQNAMTDKKGRARPGSHVLVVLSAITAAAFVSVYFIDRDRHALAITAREYGAEWPWPGAVRATLLCRMAREKDGQGQPLLQISMNGAVYALESPALKAAGWQDSRTLMDRDASGAFREGARSDIIRRGREMCGLPAPRS